jgi:hypothetical protein
VLNEPTVNESYADLARHYGTVIVPARVAYPKGKAHVERNVEIIEAWIIAYLHHRRSFSFANLNAAVAERVLVLNAQVIEGKGASRNDLFEEAERVQLAALPMADYEAACWKRSNWRRTAISR